MSGFRTPTERELKYDLDKHKIDAGWFGLFFGTGEQTAKSVAAAILVLFLAVGVFFTFTREWIEAIEFWKIIIIPIVSLVIGYLFGKS